MNLSEAGEDAGFALPVGTVTFLLTDVEGSTTAWQANPEPMGAAIARHYAILDAAVAAHGGVRPQEQGEGDSIVAAFSRATDAVRAAIAAQVAFGEERWPDELNAPLRVRMAIHTGEAQTRNDANYVGQAIIRTARLRAIAHGGQTLVSHAVHDLVVDQLGADVELLDLGRHRLKDLARPEHVWQVAAEGLPRTFPSLRSLDSIPNNLPVELSMFIGRQREIESVSALINGNRLVTITGAGGAGKTRLAQQVGANIIERFPDGTWWVELAPVDPSAVRTAIANVVSVTDPSRLVQRLQGTMLIVLDNCEHVLDEIAPLTQQILASCPGVTVLATSRGPLDVPGEVTWRLPPLSLPDVAAPVAVASLAQYEAVQLFLDRARRARPNFSLTDANGPAVAELCTRLDGIPLAIELAAARAKSLTAEQILAGLGDALRLLTGGSRLVLPRQQTLEASIAWSVALLGPEERTLLGRLGVFAGGWDLEAAEAVCADEFLEPLRILDALEHLIDQSLVRVDEQRGVARYAMLETVRQFADRQLAPEEREALRARHADWYARRAAEIGPLVEGPAQHECVALLALDDDNLSAALRHRSAGDDDDRFAAMVLHLGPYWDAADRAADGRAWTTVALERLGGRRADLRARLYLNRTLHAYWVGVGRPTDAGLALELAEQHGDVRAAGRARAQMSVAQTSADVTAALMSFDIALAESEAADDAYGCARNHVLRLDALFHNGHLRRAREALERAEPVVRALGNPMLLGWWHCSRASIAQDIADHAIMRAALGESGPTALLRTSVTESLPIALDFHLRCDLGRALPDEAVYGADVRRQTKAENYFSAGISAYFRVQVLLRNGKFQHALEIADRGPTLLGPIIARVHAALCLGDMAGARMRLAAAEDLMVNPRRSVDLDVLRALIARADGDHHAAEAAAHRALATAVEEGLVREPVTILEVLAGLAAAQGAWAHAARLSGTAQKVRDNHPLRDRPEPFETMLAADLAATRAALGDDAFDAAWNEGGRLTRDEAIAFAQRMRGERARPTLGWASLTPTERRVVELARIGRSNAQIASELLMGIETVKTHLSRVYSKLGVANRTQLAALTGPPPSASR